MDEQCRMGMRSADAVDVAAPSTYHLTSKKGKGACNEKSTTNDLQYVSRDGRLRCPAVPCTALHINMFRVRANPS